MQIRFASLMVKDQEQALQFYSNVLGFEKVADIPMGEYRWLTVRSPEGIKGVELVLEPLGFSPARTYQKALYEAGIPATAFTTENILVEFQRLKVRGVKFLGEPIRTGIVTSVAFDDTCGNLVNLVQQADVDHVERWAPS
jgi:catechol 2,3-dioxygenase-like lactoylglutathione lyase family enzyme